MKNQYLSQVNFELKHSIMKKNILISFCLMLNLLAGAQDMRINATSSNASTAELTTSRTSAEVLEFDNTIQALVYKNSPVGVVSVFERDKERVVEDQVLFTRPDKPASNIGSPVMRFPENNAELDAVFAQGFTSNSPAVGHRQGQNSAATPKESQQQNAAQNRNTNPINNARQTNARNTSIAAISVAPNPVVEAAIIAFEGDPLSIDRTFQLFDLTGRLVRMEQFEGNQFIFKRNNLNMGIYFILISDKNGLLGSRKIVIR